MDVRTLDQYMLFLKVYLCCTSKSLSLGQHRRETENSMSSVMLFNPELLGYHSISFSLQTFFFEEYGLYFYFYLMNKPQEYNALAKI